MHTISTILLLSSVLLLGVVGITTATTNTIKAQNPFDITTEQSPADQQALITVKLATNNTVVIPTNGTIIEVPGNVTQIDNDTVVIAPDNETVSELPGNVTVITPAPEPCGCPTAGNETAGGGAPATGIEPVKVTPAPGQEVTIENATIVASNETGIVVEGQGNDTGTVPQSQPPAAELGTGDNITVTGTEPAGDNTTGGLVPSGLSTFIPNLNDL